MPRTTAFYSRQEALKPADKRVYHTNTSCAAGQDVRPADKQFGTPFGYRECRDCVTETAKGN